MRPRRGADARSLGGDDRAVSAGHKMARQSHFTPAATTTNYLPKNILAHDFARNLELVVRASTTAELARYMVEEFPYGAEVGSARWWTRRAIRRELQRREAAS